ncbi:RNA polymerase sigma-70 factor [Marinilabiliaceae bacterium ANBcel2]|nr:RNA polymerase sigma-70 factor [Marinilabiliaceae bacterium ANBcel2]
MKGEKEILYFLSSGIKRGEESAFRKVFDLYSNRIKRFSMTFFEDEADADDLVQTVFVKLWEKRFSIDPQKCLRSFLFQITANLAYDILRKRSSEFKANQQAALNNSKEHDMVNGELIYNDYLNLFEKEIAKMPVQQQKIFKLKREEQLSSLDIARMLNISPRTVENHIYRATCSLRAVLQKYDVLS